MTAQHTKGPWVAGTLYEDNDEHGGDEFIDVKFRNEPQPGLKSSGYVCRVEVGHRNEYARAIAQANARLIAAAPELLAALEDLLLLGAAEQFGQWEEWEEVIHARALISSLRNSK